MNGPWTQEQINTVRCVSFSAVLNFIGAYHKLDRDYEPLDPGRRSKRVQVSYQGCDFRFILTGEKFVNELLPEGARSLPKLERVIAAQIRRVEKLRQLDPNSPECRNEEADLDVLVATRDNVMNNLNAKRPSNDRESLADYFLALERLKARRAAINNDAVSIEAGRKKGSIKKSRPVFAKLIAAIEAAVAEQAEG